ncbi:methyltransferase domain-containing protein [Streptomyces corynorhini]|uniref:Protein-L-isoaspartate O-methyltransferase n=1 Tax=Streptomyces corynorhini TaxID=2282652 RepID=A0A370B119_9ACTN|nr:methyltransferase domain-containing protein [Streptomyces corynorhini]RDG35281.1 methyltransferase domain-containing protein [Streptomyces corynorhini]
MGAQRYEPYGPDDPAAAEARAALVAEIAATGALADPAWRAAFEEVPRHVFVPYYFVSRPGGYDRLWSGDPEPARRARWLRGAYADGPLAIRVRDGELISSSSQPSLMATMLAELDVRDGDRVLEIGAGSGYNAALLSHRLGDGQVTTVDLDPEITESARAHLATAGYRPEVVTGDGARGCPRRAPFDRIVATCTLPAVPVSWLAQCRPGARILAPLATGLIALRVGEGAGGGEGGRDGGGGRDGAGDTPCAEGRFLHTAAYFVPLRGVPEADPEARRPLGGRPGLASGNELFRFLLTLTADRLDPHEALALWERERRPDRERFGVTVVGDRQWAWLDDPTGPYTWPLPGGGPPARA